MARKRDISSLLFLWVGLGGRWGFSRGVIVLVGCVNFIIPLKAGLEITIGQAPGTLSGQT